MNSEDTDGALVVLLANSVEVHGFGAVTEVEVIVVLETGDVAFEVELETGSFKGTNTGVDDVELTVF